MNLLVEQQRLVGVFFRNQRIGDQKLDVLVENRVVVEVKAGERLLRSHVSQMPGYLKNTKYQLGLLVNFGSKVEIKRVILMTPNS